MIHGPLILIAFVLASTFVVVSAESRLRMCILLSLLPAMLIAMLLVNPIYAPTVIGYTAVLAAMFISLTVGGLWIWRIVDLGY